MNNSLSKNSTEVGRDIQGLRLVHRSFSAGGSLACPELAEWGEEGLNAPRRLVNRLLVLAALASCGSVHAQTGIYVNPNNNVGIGTASPDFKFQVNVGNPATYGLGVYNTNDNLKLLFGTTTGSYLNIQGKTISTNTPYNITLQAEGGNVGIGTTSPDLKSQVNVGAAATYGLGVYNTNDNLKLLFGTTTGSYLNIQGKTISANTPYNIALQAEGGNVGIGTASPVAKLDVIDPTANDVILRVKSSIGGAGAQNAILYLRPTGPKQGQIAVIATSDLVFGESSSDPGAITSPHVTIQNTTGNVGIGTTSPGAKLDVVDPVNDAILRVKSASNGAQNAILYLRPTGPRQAQIAVIATSDLVLGESSSDPGAITSPHLTIKSTSGNVGIGTTSPQYMLDVAGQVRASAFIAPSQTYADFVFKTGYKLAHLSDVETAIKKDGHLPGIPSEAEAKAHGIDLASMQVKLLQKIEELTLHQIEQQKHQVDEEKILSAQESQLSDQQNQLKEQARRIENLEKENAELRDKVTQ
jgi:hypothetical protein